jgi:hypothetical protein
MEGNQLLQPRSGNISVPMGVIAAVNQDLQRAALRREDGTYSVIVYQDSWQLVVGERVAGKLFEPGTTTLTLANGSSALAVVEAVYQTAAEALRSVRRTG